MAEQNRAFKKLTSASGFIRFASILCLILSVVAVALEPISKIIYNMTFKNDVKYVIVKGYVAFFTAFQPAIIMCVLSLILIVAAFSSKTKKNIGPGFSAVYVFLPLAASASSVVGLIDYIKSDLFDWYMKGADNLKFRGMSILLVYALPLFIAFILLICGIILCCKYLGEKVRVEVPTIQRRVKASKAEPQSFMQTPPVMMPQSMPAPQADNSGFGAPVPPVMQPSGIAPQNEEPAAAAEPEKPIIPEAPKQESSGTKVCPNCGTELSSAAKFCKVCGTPVE